MPQVRICWYVVILISSRRSRMVSITLDTMPWARISWYVISLYRCSRRDRLVSSTLDTRLGGRIIRRVVSITLDPMQWAKINRHTKKRMHEEESIRECRLPMRRPLHTLSNEKKVITFSNSHVSLSSSCVEGTWTPTVSIVCIS